MSKPTILLIHGSWHTPTHYTPILTLLTTHSFPTSCAALPTVGLREDAAAITAELHKLIEEEGKDVVVLAHSYGGVVAAQAVKKDFGKEARSGEGKGGGVLGIVFMWEELPPFIPVDENDMCLMADPVQRLYSDLPPDEQQQWVSLLVKNAKHTQTAPVDYAARKCHPVTYFYCENDQAMPFDIQKQMVERVKGEGVDVKEETCSAGHSPFLSMPERVIEVLERA